MPPSLSVYGNKSLHARVSEGMKALSLLAAFAFLVAIPSVAIHPFGQVKKTTHPSPTADVPSMPLEVASIIERACQDCHSAKTVWPWYSYVAPISWAVEKDVSLGRNRLNFSEWSQYSFAQRQELLADIATAVKNHEMPIAKYTKIHHAARLSDAERDVVYQWARLARRKLREEEKNKTSREYFPNHLGTAK
jgi:acyl-CoA reductase-like NAD-dependent aldehyde dehydrogenase